YIPMSAYAASKLACVMLACEQQRRLDAAGWPLMAVAAHPGYSATNLQYHSGSGLQDLVMRAAEKIPFLVQPAERGALPELYAATVRDVPPGAYIGPDGPGELTGHPRVVGSTGASRDESVAAALWDRCEARVAPWRATRPCRPPRRRPPQRPRPRARPGVSPAPRRDPRERRSAPRRCFRPAHRAARPQRRPPCPRGRFRPRPSPPPRRARRSARAGGAPPPAAARPSPRNSLPRTSPDAPDGRTHG